MLPRAVPAAVVLSQSFNRSRCEWDCASVCFFVVCCSKTTAEHTLYFPAIQLIISSVCMCASAVAGVMAGLGRHSPLKERVLLRVCVCVCASLRSMLN